MLKKPCPWCETKIAHWQLGNRPKKKIGFFTVLPNLAVCPYCSNPVKISGKSLYFLLVFIPVIIISFLPIVTDYELPSWFIPVGVFTMIVAFIFAMVFSVFKKDYD